ncbi:MAG: hypothetical protein ABJB97_12680, partial [Acidobacteriota bacterium]
HLACRVSLLTERDPGLPLGYKHLAPLERKTDSTVALQVESTICHRGAGPTVTILSYDEK